MPIIPPYSQWREEKVPENNGDKAKLLAHLSGKRVLINHPDRTDGTLYCGILKYGGTPGPDSDVFFMTEEGPRRRVMVHDLARVIVLQS